MPEVDDVCNADGVPDADAVDDAGPVAVDEPVGEPLPDRELDAVAVPLPLCVPAEVSEADAELELIALTDALAEPDDEGVLEGTAVRVDDALDELLPDGVPEPEADPLALAEPADV